MSQDHLDGLAEISIEHELCNKLDFIVHLITGMKYIGYAATVFQYDVPIQTFSSWDLWYWNFIVPPMGLPYFTERTKFMSIINVKCQYIIF